jgi:hypothetical protein
LGIFSARSFDAKDTPTDARRIFGGTPNFPMPSPSSARFWSLVDRWGISDDQALELVSYDGKLPTAGTRPRFKLPPEQRQIVGTLIQIDNAVATAGLGVAWLKRKGKETDRTPLDLMRAGAMDQVSLLITEAMLRASIRKPGKSK